MLLRAARQFIPQVIDGFVITPGMETLGQRIKRRREELLLDQVALAKRVGFSQPALSKLEDGKSERTRFLAELAKALNTSVEWLLTGKGEPSGQASQEPASNESDHNVENLPQSAKAVPLISWVQAGAFCEAQDEYNVGDAEQWLSCPVRHGPRTYALRVRGESMRNPGSKPSFEDGDIIFVDPDLGANHKSLVITKLDESNEVTFKRLLIDGSSWFLEALNPSWPNRIISIQKEAHICGVVIARLESFI